MRLNSIFATLALALCLASPAHAWDPEIGATPRPLSKIEYLDGSKVDLESLRGNPVVLYFGADWCQPCTDRGRPAVIAAMKRFKSKGLQTVFVSMDDNIHREGKIRESQVLGIPIAMAKLEICPPRQCPDGLRDQGEFGRIYGYPSAFVLDAAGIVRARHQGGRGVQGDLESSIEKVIAK